MTSSGTAQFSSRQSSRNHQPTRPTRHRRPAQQARTTTPAPSSTSHLDAALAAAQQQAAPLTTSFADFALPAQVVAVLTDAGITQPTPIQAKTLPDALAGRDLLGRAQTGSGKTLGFGLPMLTRLAATRTRPVTKSPRGLVLVPTRELAQQVADALTPAAGALNLHVGVVVGGTSIGKQVDELRRGLDVLIATPGRLIDLMDRDAARLDAVAIAVLDEADHMADLGFLPAVTRILDATPDDRQCMLFSATLDKAVGRLVTRYLREPADPRRRPDRDRRVGHDAPGLHRCARPTRSRSRPRSAPGPAARCSSCGPSTAPRGWPSSCRTPVRPPSRCTAT